MPKYRKKPVVIEAVQWFVAGDHSTVTELRNHHGDLEYGKCKNCGEDLSSHGWVATLEGGHIVCPEDWIITGVQGENYPCKPDIFEKTYEAVTD